MRKGIASWVGLTVATILCFIGSAVAVNAAVHVKGYTKKDGTYVTPHYRSSPNGTKSDNWSTKGNVNPYTGKAGTKSSGAGSGASYDPALRSSAPVSTAAPSASTPRPPQAGAVAATSPKASLEAPVGGSDKLRISKAEHIHELGYEVDWHKYSASQLTDMEIKAEKAKHLTTLGYPQDWESLSLAEMDDREKRIETAVALKKRGVAVDWQKSSQSELADVQARVSAAERLGRDGKIVDWQKYSASQLSAMEAEMARRRR